MSFSAKADMKFLWEYKAKEATISAYCIFANSEEDVGTIYLLAKPKQLSNSATITLTPLVEEVNKQNGKNPYMYCLRE